MFNTSATMFWSHGSWYSKQHSFYEILVVKGGSLKLGTNFQFFLVSLCQWCWPVRVGVYAFRSWCRSQCPFFWYTYLWGWFVIMNCSLRLEVLLVFQNWNKCKLSITWCLNLVYSLTYLEFDCLQYRLKSKFFCWIIMKLCIYLMNPWI